MDALLLTFTAGVGKGEVSHSKSLRNDIANFSVFEWGILSASFCELVPSLDLEVKEFSKSLIST